MGAELVLSLRLPPLYGTSVFCTHKALFEPAADFPRRRRTVFSAEAHSNAEGNSDWKFHGAFDNHQHHHHHHHNQHQSFHHQNEQFLHQFHPHHHSQHHPWKGSLDIGQQPGRLGSGFSIASESDVGEMEKQDCASSFFHNGRCSSFPSKGDHITINGTCAEGAVAGVDLPLSLRMLKRKQQDSMLMSGLSEVGNSLLNAFSSVVSMMKTLQSHTLHIRQQFFEQEIEGLLSQVQREMHVSFVWLFQQVFACTPELMVLVMVLLADFTAFSVVNNVPILPTSLYTPPVSIISMLSNKTQIDRGFRDFFHMSLTSSPSVAYQADGLHNSNGGWVGNGGKGTYPIAGDADEGPDSAKSMVDLNKAPYSMNDQLPTELSSTTSMASHDVSISQYGLPFNDHTFLGDDNAESDFSAMAAALAFEELAVVDDISNNEPLSRSINSEGVDAMHAAEIEEIARSSNHLILDQLTVRSLVAPFTARIDEDNYSCYDRTDLAYQDAIGNDSNNSLLLANYAQFLFLVRKDHDRAEELFQKAVVCDPFDCDAISRFASFLWLARHNLGAAEKAYQAALRADPTNSFHAANYAHFLWNSGL